MSGTTHPLPTPSARRAPSAAAIGLSRRDFLAGLGSLTAGLALDATLIARHDIDLVRRSIPIRRLPAAFHGFRIVQLSDIHLEEFTEPLFLRLAIDRINRLVPDLVLLTGDFVSDGPLPFSVSRRAVHRCAELLQELHAPQRYAILGNHDNGVGSLYVVDALERRGTPVLVNRYVPIERPGARLWLGGTDDPSTTVPVLNLAVPAAPDGPVLLLCHGPDYADVVARHPRGPLVDLMLSGHSHGGQVRLPLLGALNLPPWGEKYVQGLFHIGPMQLYVNRGLGTTGLPLRLNCPPEITLLTLRPADQPPADS